MNTYNHHRIIDQIADRIKEHPGFVKKTLKDASNFTDDFIKAEWKYFLYHFYYDIRIDNDTIVLERVDEGTNKSADSMDRCDTNKLHPKLNEKKFFSIINDRPESPRHEVLDASNQSDNVAFLHAMGSSCESKKDSLKRFKEHLSKCFAEFLFINDYEKALFVLGIAFHSIMDSFTPSHTGFKKYTEQDMAKHAQGDVIPFKDDKVYFEPGQYTEDVKLDPGIAIAAQFKGYDSDHILNTTEKKMLDIFLNSYLDTDNDIKKILSSNSFLPYGSSTLLLSSMPIVGKINYEMSGINGQKTNDILATKHYRSDAFDFSEKAIEVITELFKELYDAKKNRLNDYQAYIEYKKGKILNEEFLKNWEEQYNSIQNHPASDVNLYKK